jgi:hypothetical protein
MCQVLIQSLSPGARRAQATQDVRIEKQADSESTLHFAKLLIAIRNIEWACPSRGGVVIRPKMRRRIQSTGLWQEYESERMVIVHFATRSWAEALHFPYSATAQFKLKYSVGKQ